MTIYLIASPGNHRNIFFHWRLLLNVQVLMKAVQRPEGSAAMMEDWGPALDAQFKTKYKLQFAAGTEVAIEEVLQLGGVIFYTTCSN